jgi:hypothetical protein
MTVGSISTRFGEMTALPRVIVSVVSETGVTGGLLHRPS